tara:strand:+ start:9679 stop:10170 length:492 start_codon:yes stop_codon:yes gene_type:complete
MFLFSEVSSNITLMFSAIDRYNARLKYIILQVDRVAICLATSGFSLNDLISCPKLLVVSIKQKITVNKVRIMIFKIPFSSYKRCVNLLDIGCQIVYKLFMKYEIIEGIHTDTSNIETLDPATRKVHSALDKIQAELLAGKLVRSNIGNYGHRVWIRPAKVKNS